MSHSAVIFKPATLANVCFPQLPSFCAIAAGICASNTMLGTSLTQEDAHLRYGIGSLTKLQLQSGDTLKDLASRTRAGTGLSNWDVIRLVNAICLDTGQEPYSMLLCGADFIRETDQRQLSNLLAWLEHDANQAIIHIKNHYLVFVGAQKSRINHDYSFIAANSSKNFGPCSSIGFSQLLELAKTDNRYGMILFSLEPLPHSLFSCWTEEMMPPESSNQMRFARLSMT